VRSSIMSVCMMYDRERVDLREMPMISLKKFSVLFSRRERTMGVRTRGKLKK